MTTHAVVLLKVSNPETLALYREKAAEALARHGGSVVQASPEPSVLEGTAPTPDMMALLQFPDRAAAQAWKADPDLQDIHALRMGIGASDILLL
ncbi:DUF1330 domain-containing protein [uncultured Tateyamaria sp.]|uniref:DUF1330 domain-containing protein n=1 Tax=uncultured Tateyamaria sp. TaxID=455651 RepID=UPI00260B8258|nr:DUF1330 domain-containing protein [uncultured Tateyamaria sp.]